LTIAVLALGAAGYAVFSTPRHDRLAAEARAQREVIVWGNADASAVAPLVDAFAKRHPDLVVRYTDVDSTRIYDRIVAAEGRGEAVPDLVWSSAMDLQAKLINDGHAQHYVSPEKGALPRTAVWKDMGYGVTAEPVAIVYNKRLIAPGDVPRTHQALAALLHARRAALTGKVATYDPARSNVGYLYVTQDQAMTRDTRALLEAIAATRPLLSPTTKPMMEAVASGRVAIAYNVVGPYAQQQAAADDRIGVVFPHDYTLVASRVAFIPRHAPHPAGARLFLDFMLSRTGQVLLARAFLPPVRTDLHDGRSALSQARPIRGGPQLFVNLDPVKRRRFLAEWDTILAEGADIQ
jgi:iron(III) transport system substrate-binding protein